MKSLLFILVECFPFKSRSNTDGKFKPNDLFLQGHVLTNTHFSAVYCFKEFLCLWDVFFVRKIRIDGNFNRKIKIVEFLCCSSWCNTVQKAFSGYCCGGSDWHLGNLISGNYAKSFHTRVTFYLENIQDFVIKGEVKVVKKSITKYMPVEPVSKVHLEKFN